jgi:oxygen-independent coproporphyrinogen III oxidase
VISEELLRRFDLNGPRYTSYPTADRFSTSIGASDYASALESVRGATSLYVHVPFCKSLCYYCACNKIVTKSTSVADEYLAYLKREIELVADRSGALEWVQIAFGGGTPNFLAIEQLESLFETLNKHTTLRSDREQSIEIDPRYLREGYMAGLRVLGFNRVSFGVQDFDERVQALIHRFQSFEQTRAAVSAARDAGFASISFDLVYGLPLQSRESFATTLERTLSLEPDRIALFNYAHIPERFKAQRRIPTDSLPSIEERVALFLYATERLIDAGYVAIGLDHFAKPNDSLARAAADRTLRRNFQGYSTHSKTQLIGIGVSAISQLDCLFAQNSAQIDVYQARIARNEFATHRGIALTFDDRVRARAIENLMCHGMIEWQSLADEFAIKPDAYFASEMIVLRRMQRDGIVSVSEEAIRITDAGHLLLRAVAMVFDAHRERPRAVDSNAVDSAVSPVRFSRIA